jgi:hypothetical protein
MMHATIQLLEYWAVAFLTLGLAVVLLSIYYGLIGNDLDLLTAGKEAAIAAFASLVEGGGLWLIQTYLPSAMRAMIFPAVVVAVLYKVAHFEDWSRWDAIMLLAFQVAIVFIGTSLVYGHFESALILLVCFGGVLAIIGKFLKDI